MSRLKNSLGDGINNVKYVISNVLVGMICSCRIWIDLFDDFIDNPFFLFILS